MHRWNVMASIADQRIVGIVRTADGDAAYEAAMSLFDAGLRIVEVALTTRRGLAAVERLATENPGHWVVGAGTVLDATTARLAVDAGATFLVSPSLNENVVRTAHRYGVAVIPGVATPTEAIQAAELGADAVKLFPACAYGPSVLGAVLQALPHLAVIPTGGVTVDDAHEWIAAGAVAVGLGTALGREGPAGVRALLDRMAVAA